jgi:hypothetical protein
VLVGAVDGVALLPALGAAEAAPLPFGAAHAASNGAIVPPAAMAAPSLSTSRRLRFRPHGLSLVG